MNLNFGVGEILTTHNKVSKSKSTQAEAQAQALL